MSGNGFGFGPATALPAGNLPRMKILQRSILLVLRSGEKLGGKIEKVGTNLVHLSQLTGAEFFEAVVDLESISAVVVRAKNK